MAQPFDAEKLSLTGEPQPLPLRIGTAYQTAMFGAAPDVLVYRSSAGTADRQFTWFDLKMGEPLGKVGIPELTGDYFVLSPDETRVAYSKQNSGGPSDVWILDLARGSSSRLTFGDEERSFGDGMLPGPPTVGISSTPARRMARGRLCASARMGAARKRCF